MFTWKPRNLVFSCLLGFVVSVSYLFLFSDFFLLVLQVEYYFSDENLPNDKYMLGFVKKNKEGFGKGNLLSVLDQFDFNCCSFHNLVFKWFTALSILKLCVFP